VNGLSCVFKRALVDVLVLITAAATCRSSEPILTAVEHG
jgi:hypothetical protein